MNGTTAFDQMPYFTVVGKLEEEKRQFEAEREQWKRDLLERNGDMHRIETRLKQLDEAATSTPI